MAMPGSRSPATVAPELTRDELKAIIITQRRLYGDVLLKASALLRRYTDGLHASQVAELADAIDGCARSHGLIDRGPSLGMPARLKPRETDATRVTMSERILAALEYRATGLSFRDLATEFDLAPSDEPALRKALTRLSLAGRVMGTLPAGQRRPRIFTLRSTVVPFSESVG